MKLTLAEVLAMLPTLKAVAASQVLPAGAVVRLRVLAVVVWPPGQLPTMLTV